nr:immunoglobulin light chain junction region [Macaca mulatta]MOV66143.1 immunoglobulin light chain junction region [Macaca mulatta]MOV66886.1 immunoglobulin light chain junction region [Macaca mulatta]MOV67175.1 immunoglobulin light chain junction region [Macaca mulatta]MOV67502.1 immunoglobulin light chain junction region [Macaca mulatta]
DYHCQVYDGSAVLF